MHETYEQLKLDLEQAEVPTFVPPLPPSHQ